MLKQWYELKDFVETERARAYIKDKYCWQYFDKMFNEMNEIESKHACQSLKEAGY